MIEAVRERCRCAAVRVAGLSRRACTIGPWTNRPGICNSCGSSTSVHAAAFYGVRKMTAHLRRRVRRSIQRVRRLMREMGLEAIYPKPHLSLPRRPSALSVPAQGLLIDRPDQVWARTSLLRLRRGSCTAAVDGLVESPRALLGTLRLPGGDFLPSSASGSLRQALRRSSTPTRACSSPARRSPAL